MATPEHWIVQTQETLGTLIAKPTMSVKFLSKPPFRFLYDAFAAVAAQTGFGVGLCDALPQEKEQKLEFMTQLIALIGLALGEALAVNPIKVICGLEPEHTNFMLQRLHLAATTQAHRSAELVGRVQAGETPPAPAAEVAEAAPAEPEEAPAEPAAPEAAAQDTSNENQAAEAPGELGEELEVAKPITYDAEQQAVRDMLDAVDVSQFDLPEHEVELRSMEYKDSADVAAQYAELEERAKRLAEMKREKQQQLAARQSQLPELGAYLDESSSDYESSGDERGEVDAARLLDDIDAELEPPSPPSKPPPEEGEAAPPPPPEEAPPPGLPKISGEDANIAKAPKKKKKKRTKEEREAKRERRRLREEAIERAKYPESKHGQVQRAILLDSEEGRGAAESPTGDREKLQEVLSGRREDEETKDHGDAAKLIEQLMGSLGPTWLTFVMASPPPALVAQHGAATVFNLLRMVHDELTHAASPEFFNSEAFLYDLPPLGEELSSSFPNDWRQFVQTTPKEFLEERYGLEPTLELFQGIAQLIFDHLEELDAPLPDALQYRAPQRDDPGEAAEAVEAEERPERTEHLDSERRRLRTLGTAIVGGR